MLDDDIFDDVVRYCTSFAEHPPRDYTGFPMWTDTIMLSDDEFHELQELRRIQSDNELDYNNGDIPRRRP